jgi:SAM-dependent methyltransferase
MSQPAPSTSWAERGAYWARTGPRGKSDIDSGNQAIIAAAGIEEGDRVLDIASGGGEPAISIALKVGEAGSVTATDANPEMLEGARQRAARLGLANIRFEIAAMEKLPFDDGTFGAVTCRFGIMFPDDAVAAVREHARVAKAGAPLVYMVHGPARANTLYTVLRETVHAFLGEPVSPAHNRRFRFSARGELTELLSAAGLVDVAEKDFGETQTRPGGSAQGPMWQRLLERSYGARLEGMSEERLDTLHENICRAFEPYLKGDHYELISTDRLGIGRKPAT